MNDVKWKMNEGDRNLGSIDESLCFYPMLELKDEIKRKNDKNKNFNLRHLKESVKWSKTQRQQTWGLKYWKKLRKLGKPFSLQISTHEQERRSRLLKHHRRKWKESGTRNKKETDRLIVKIKHRHIMKNVFIIFRNILHEDQYTFACVQINFRRIFSISIEVPPKLAFWMH